jgi:hypothetical protein
MAGKMENRDGRDLGAGHKNNLVFDNLFSRSSKRRGGLRTVNTFCHALTSFSHTSGSFYRAAGSLYGVVIKFVCSLLPL